MLFGGGAGGKRAKIPPLPGPGVLLPGIQSILSRREFPNHGYSVPRALIWFSTPVVVPRRRLAPEPSGFHALAARIIRSFQVNPYPSIPMIKPLLVLAGLHLAVAAGAQANGTPREVQLKMLEHQRKVLLQMVDSMPERLYRDRATPAQRDFANQIHHAAGSAAVIARSMMNGPALTLPDTGAAFNTRAGLRSFVSVAYDYAVNLLRTQTEAARGETVNLFGSQMTRWQVWDEIHMHTVWTAGQVVANFRKHNMAPPAFSFF